MSDYKVIALPSQGLKSSQQWVKARLDYEPLFSILDGMGKDADRRFWIERLEASEDKYDTRDNMRQASTGVKIELPDV